MNIQRHTTQYFTKATKKMPPLGVVIHNTVTQGLADPHPQGSWHFEVGRSGDIHQYVSVDGAGIDYAWHVRACDRWRPAWMRQRDTRTSEANSCTVGIELVSYAGNAAGVAVPEPYTEAQYTAIRELLAHLEALYGSLPVVGHGQLQLDRTDPVRFDYARAGLVWRGDGYRYEAEEDPAMIGQLEDTIRDLERQIKELRETIGQRDSRIGSLENDVEKPLRAEVADLKASVAPLEARVAQMEEQLREAMALAGKATAQRPSRVVLEYGDGELGYVPEPA